MKKITGILAVLLGIVIVVALVGYILQRQGCISFQYSVSINGDEYEDGDTVKLKHGENTLKITQPFYVSDDITIGIYRNEDKDFDFTCGGEILGYAGIDELTAAFDIKEVKDETILTMQPDTTMQTILQKLYPDTAITVSPEIDIAKDSYFYLNINFGKKTMKINLMLELIPTTIALDRSSIIF